MEEFVDENISDDISDDIGNTYPHNEAYNDTLANNTLQLRYYQLLQTFAYVCKKYNIKQCNTCKKYRKDIVQCPCGVNYCKKCVTASYPLLHLHTTFVRCSMCEELTCSNCSIDNCSECDKLICRRQGCIAYICDNSKRSVCNSIICRDCCDISEGICAKCKFCLQIICKNCRVDHDPCHPILCSCSNLVYPCRIGTREYPIITCKNCNDISCDTCRMRGMRHRAYHSIIPFIIANNRGDLPHELPLEIVRMIWERCL